jgi:hypothetical protein
VSDAFTRNLCRLRKRPSQEFPTRHHRGWVLILLILSSGFDMGAIARWSPRKNQPKNRLGKVPHFGSLVRQWDTQPRRCAKRDHLRFSILLRYHRTWFGSGTPFRFRTKIIERLLHPLGQCTSTQFETIHRMSSHDWDQADTATVLQSGHCTTWLLPLRLSQVKTHWIWHPGPGEAKIGNHPHFQWNWTKNPHNCLWNLDHTTQMGDKTRGGMLPLKNRKERKLVSYSAKKGEATNFWNP